MASSEVVNETSSVDSEEFVFVTYSEERLIRILTRLWAMKKNKERYCAISEDECITIAYQASIVFASEAILIDVEPPVTVCGDTHGQFRDLLRVLEVGGMNTRYLFLGDYVDRGENSIEVILTLFIYKILSPTYMLMLRGNHEAALCNFKYGFLNECIERYNFGVYAAFNDCFNFMPVAAIIGHRIFCCHGGIAKDLDDVRDVAGIERPLKRPSESPVVNQLTWNDPNVDALRTDDDGWGKNPRGPTCYVFGKKPLRKFLENNRLDLLARAHQVVQEGFDFFDERKCVTIFSAPNYQDGDNLAGMMNVAEDLRITFTVLHATGAEWTRVDYDQTPVNDAEGFRGLRFPNTASVPNPPEGKGKERDQEELRGEINQHLRARETRRLDNEYTSGLRSGIQRPAPHSPNLPPVPDPARPTSTQTGGRKSRETTEKSKPRISPSGPRSHIQQPAPHSPNLNRRIGNPPVPSPPTTQNECCLS